MPIFHIIFERIDNFKFRIVGIVYLKDVLRKMLLKAMLSRAHSLLIMHQITVDIGLIHLNSGNW